MAKAGPPPKTKTTHPRTGSAKRIDSRLYDAFSQAILQSLKGSGGLSFTGLTAAVEPRIRKSLPGFKGSVSWYTISVRLDLENRGLVECITEKGKKLNRLPA